MTTPENKQSVMVCPLCERPTVWTFMFRGREWYCPSCGRGGDCFWAKSVDATPELQALEVEIKAFFNLCRRDIITPGAYHEGCPKCDDHNCGPHSAHASAEELAASLSALQRLRQYAEEHACRHDH